MEIHPTSEQVRVADATFAQVPQAFATRNAVKPMSVLGEHVCLEVDVEAPSGGFQSRKASSRDVSSISFSPCATSPLRTCCRINDHMKPHMEQRYSPSGSFGTAACP